MGPCDPLPPNRVLPLEETTRPSRVMVRVGEGSEGTFTGLPSEVIVTSVKTSSTTAVPSSATERTRISTSPAITTS